ELGTPRVDGAVYMSPGATKREVDAFDAQLRAIPEIGEVSRTDPAESLASQRRAFADHPEYMAKVGVDQVGSAFVLTARPGEDPLQVVPKVRELIDRTKARVDILSYWIQAAPVRGPQPALVVMERTATQAQALAVRGALAAKYPSVTDVEF